MHTQDTHRRCGQVLPQSLRPRRLPGSFARDSPARSGSRQVANRCGLRGVAAASAGFAAASRPQGSQEEGQGRQRAAAGAGHRAVGKAHADLLLAWCSAESCLVAAFAWVFRWRGMLLGDRPRRGSPQLVRRPIAGCAGGRRCTCGAGRDRRRGRRDWRRRRCWACGAASGRARRSSCGGCRRRRPRGPGRLDCPRHRRADR
mmetsp:Transcript_106058/g.304968  ORF Transcript_106058/g.304968 Transcript_106058/m.304968 type:complete len:202 (+) Transcript_106058:293-898(+)